MPKSKERKQVVLVTGASTGIGLALAHQLLPRDDLRLVLTARQGSLTRFADAGIEESSRVHLRKLDVTSEIDREVLIDDIEVRWGGVDVLVNNAGVSYRSVVEHVTEHERLAQMNVNFRSPMELTRLVLPTMRDKRAGKIINISSVGGMMAMPTMAVYSASKFALEGATEALYYEVKPWGISVTLVEPGFVNGDGFEKVRLTLRSEHAIAVNDSPYHAHYEFMSGFIAKTSRRAFATPEKVAKKIVQTINRRAPPLRVSGTFDAYLFGMLRRLLPRRVYHWVLYRSLPKVKRWGPDV